MPSPFFDRGRLGQLQLLVEACRPDDPPHAELLPDSERDSFTELAVLSGSFNPLTCAHLALAAAAEQQGLGPVAFALSTLTVDKEHPEPAFLADRLLVLQLSIERTGRRLIALLNRGLYVDQAELLRSYLPALNRLTFLVGFDKIVQIFDPRYYDDRDAALRRLFAAADFAVAPRSQQGPTDLTQLLAGPENQEFADRVRPLRITPARAHDSSSEVREALRAGHPPAAPLPPESARFIAETGCYGPDPEVYARRLTLLR